MPDHFDIDSHNSDFDTLRKKANVKGSLRKNLEHWHYISANPSAIGTIENGYKIAFFATPISIFFKIICYSERKLCNLHCERTFKIWQNEGN